MHFLRLLSLSAFSAFLILTSFGQAAYGSSQWSMAGQNLHNTRHQQSGKKISLAEVENLAPKWVFDTGADVSATPAVDGKAVYVPDWAGNLFKIDAKTGEEIWSRRISDYTLGDPRNFARTTPAIHGNKLIFGDQGGRLFPPLPLTPGLEGARVMAVDKNTGDLVWITKVDEHPAAIITQSAVAFGNRVYVGVSSFESTVAGFDPTYPCCTFRGSVVALDVNTGEIIWKTFMTPPPQAFPPDVFSGAPVWGSTPVVDTKRGSLYVTTGNNYTVPTLVSDCVEAAGDDTIAVQACFAGIDNYFDSVMALDLKTGAVKWVQTAIPFDAWTFACIFGGPGTPNCPDPFGPDFDFGQGAMLFKTSNGQELLGIGQKSGKYWALDPSTGEVVWTTQVGPGGFLGGIMWGSATDGERIYVAVANSEGDPALGFRWLDTHSVVKPILA